MATAPVFDPQRFLASLLWHPIEIAGSSEVLSHNGVSLSTKLEISEEDALYQLPADRLYELPDFVEVDGVHSNLVAQALGDHFLVFQGRLAKQFAEHLELTFDEGWEVPRPSGIAGTLDVYVQQPDGSWAVLDEDDDVEALAASGAVYDNLYYIYEETPGDTVVMQRWLIAYESSRFPGFTLLGNKRDGYWTDEAVRTLAERNLERRRKEQQAYDAFNALRLPDRSGAGPDAPFDNRRRQQFIQEPYYINFCKNLKEMSLVFAEEMALPDTGDEGKSLLTRSIADDVYELLSLHYTAGVPCEELRDELNDVVTAYEQYQRALAVHEEDPDTSPFLPLLKSEWVS